MVKPLLLIALFWPALSPAQVVNFEGTFQEDIDRLKQEVPSFSNEKKSLSEIDQVIRFLMGTNHYEGVEAHSLTNESGAEVLRIVTSPIRRINNIKVTGNSSLSEQEVLGLLGLREEQRLARQKILDSAENVKKAYRAKGFLQSIIRINFQELKSARVNVEIDITEGPICRLKTLSVDSPNENLVQALNKIAKSHFDKPFTDSLIASIESQFRNHFREKQYLNAQLSQPTVQINQNQTEANVRLSVENPYQFEIYTNVQNQNLTREKLLGDSLSAAQERFGSNPGPELRDRMLANGRRLGYAHMTIEFSEKSFPKDFMRRLEFEVKEGPRVRIKSLDIQGKFSRPGDYYSEFILEHSSELVSDGYYNGEDLEAGYKNLVTQLQNEGYLKAKIQSARAEFSEDKSRVSVQILLDEGPLTKLKDLVFDGATALSYAQLSETIELSKGSPLHLDVLEMSITKIKDLYLSKGYLDIQILNEKELVSYNDDNTEAIVRYEIREGPQVTVGSILLDGNDVTKQYVILKELEFTVGDILTIEKIKDSEARLQRMGLFSQISIRTPESGSNVAARTVLVQVVERNFNLGVLGGGFHNDIGADADITLKLYTGIALRNMGGHARSLSFRVEGNKPIIAEKNAADTALKNFVEYYATVGYMEPFFAEALGRRIRGKVNFGQRVQLTKREAELVKANTKTEFSLIAEKELSRYWKLSWNTWSKATTRTYAIYGDFQEEKLDIATIGPTLEWDRRDHPFNATQGHFASISSEYSHPTLGSSSSVNYVRNIASFNKYNRIGKTKIVWANSVKGGYVKNLSSAPDGAIPEERRFALGGGVSTIRGFGYQEIPYEKEVKSKLGIGLNSPLAVKSDSMYYLFKSEFRFPVWGELGLAVFYDGGGVRFSGIDLDDEYRDAAGIGFRYNTPVGAVSLDIGFKLDRKQNAKSYDSAPSREESPYHIHFSIGTF